MDASTLTRIRELIDAVEVEKRGYLAESGPRGRYVYSGRVDGAELRLSRAAVEALPALLAAVDRVAALEAALQDFSDVRHWAVTRDEFREPQHVWVGTVREHPAKIASDALAACAATGDNE